MSERGFFSASNDIKTLDGNIFSGFPWLTTQLLLELSDCWPRLLALGRPIIGLVPPTNCCILLDIYVPRDVNNTN